MDGFSDALEDALYVHALTTGRLELSKPWPEFTDEEIQRYVKQIEEKEPERLSLEVICQQPLGFFLVSHLLFSFCLLLLSFRS